MRSIIARFRGHNGHYLFWTAYAILILIVAVVGGAAGMVFGYALDLPRVEELGEVRPGTVTHVYATDGRVIGQFALEKRILIRYQDIPPLIKNAVLATEDADFFKHAGIDFRRVILTAIKNVLNWERKGASTLTMQLSKLRFTGYEQTWKRKILDALHAVEIEKNYSKEQILTFYFNQIYMGHGIYGLATAADFYYSKSLSELNLNEAATLAGIIRWPPRYSPVNDMERARMRRNVVLTRMFDEGFITDQRRRQEAEASITLNVRQEDSGGAPYVVETVRQMLAERYATDDIWNRGFRIETTIDFDFQTAASKALREGLKRFDKERVEWEGAAVNILDQGRSLDDYRHPEWRQIFHPGYMIHGLVLESSPDEAKVRLGSYTAVLSREDIEWTKKGKVDDALRPGDVAVFQLEGIDRQNRIIDAKLDRIPQVQGGLLAIDNRSGAIRAMVGGFDYRYSEFNRATQALRQPGSIFKPFTYVAAMEEGYSPYEAELDEPVNFYDGLGRLYAPENSDEKFKGRLPLYQALAESRNVPTIRLANRVGIEKIISVAQRFGIQREFLPVLPMAIGAGELTLQEITSAFSAFANNGVRAEPHLISRVEDYDRTLLEEHRTRVDEVISPEVAAKMLFLLKGIVELPTGTARRAATLGRPMAGKTGTTNDYTDSWFVGMTPQISAGVWVGHETKQTLGEKVYGSTLALPIWIDFFQQISDLVPVTDFEASWTPTSRDLRLAKEVPWVTGGETAAQLTVPLPPRKKGAFQVEDIPPPPPPRPQ